MRSHLLLTLLSSSQGLVYQANGGMQKRGNVPHKSIPCISLASAVAAAAIPNSCLAIDELTIGNVGFGRDPVDVYYLAVAIVAIGYAVKQFVTTTIDDAKDYDRRGEMANAMAAEKRKRDRASARERVQKEDMAYERLQAERGERETKRAGWKVFEDFRSGLGDGQ